MYLSTQSSQNRNGSLVSKSQAILQETALIQRQSHWSLAFFFFFPSVRIIRTRSMRSSFPASLGRTSIMSRLLKPFINRLEPFYALRLSQAWLRGRYATYTCLRLSGRAVLEKTRKFSMFHTDIKWLATSFHSAILSSEKVQQLV